MTADIQGAGAPSYIETLLPMLAGIMDRLTVDTSIGRILMPGPTYRGIWARDTGVSALGLNRLGRVELAGELLERYWGFQIDEDSNPNEFIFRNKRSANWTDADAFTPTNQQLKREFGALPTSVYIETSDFPAGTREIYTHRADLDSVAWLIIALEDYYRHSRDEVLIRRLTPRIQRALSYLSSRDDDGDGLLEQGPNQDWADTLLRHGKVSYTQAVWYRCLQAAALLFEAVGDTHDAELATARSLAVREQINRLLLSEYGFYVNFLDTSGASLHRSLDTALLVAFDVPEPGLAPHILAVLQTLDSPFGPTVIEPGFAPIDIGPSKYPPGQYHNQGIWPWITSYVALAWAKVGQPERALEIIGRMIGPSPRTMYEWIDARNGELHHEDFATAAGALAWAVTEGLGLSFGP